MVKCKGCGKAITWALNTETGKRVPLDATAIVYSAVVAGGEVRAKQERGMFVSHFQTCTKANDFSGGKKKEAATFDFEAERREKPQAVMPLREAGERELTFFRCWLRGEGINGQSAEDAIETAHYLPFDDRISWGKRLIRVEKEEKAV